MERRLSLCGTLPSTVTANRNFLARVAAKAHPAAVWSRLMTGPIHSTKNVGLNLFINYAADSPEVFTVYTMAQASRAITPRDPGGPWGQRIGVNVAGSDAWTVKVTAFVTKRNNPSDWWRYSLVVLNWYVPVVLTVS